MHVCGRPREWTTEKQTSADTWGFSESLMIYLDCRWWNAEFLLMNILQLCIDASSNVSETLYKMFLLFCWLTVIFGVWSQTVAAVCCTEGSCEIISREEEHLCKKSERFPSSMFAFVLTQSKGNNDRVFLLRAVFLRPGYNRPSSWRVTGDCLDVGRWHWSLFSSFVLYSRSLLQSRANVKEMEMV